jgi:ankyrin repeat protein
MYKFIGGFLNTLQPHSNDEINSKLIVTSEYLEFIKELIRDLEKSIETSKTEIIKDYLITKKNPLIQKIILSLKIINNDNFNIINNDKLQPLPNDKPLDIKIKFNIDKLKLLEKKIENLLNINCFHREDIINCQPITDTTLSKKKLEYVFEYIGRTFGFHEYADKLKLINITKYIILHKFTNDDNYYIVEKKTNPQNPECKFFLLHNDLSIHDITSSIERDKIIYFNKNQRIYFLNTQNNNLSRGKMYITELIKTINTIKKKNISNDTINLKLITDICDILYIKDRKTNDYMFDTIKKYDNIVIFLIYINKIKIIYDSIDNNTIPALDLFLDIKVHICFAYNYYLYLSKLMNINTTTENINVYLGKTREEVYDEFIKDVQNLCEILHKLKIKCNEDGILAKDILSNFLTILFDTNNIPFPINKEKIIPTLTGRNYVIKEGISEQNEYFKTLSYDDKVFNFISQFKILKETNVEYEQHSYTNCGENTLFNLINYLLTHKYIDEDEDEERVFKFDKTLNKDKLKRDDGGETLLYEFYNQFTDFNDLIFNYENNDDIKNEFAAIFYKQTKDPNVYARGDVCEIIPSEKNIIKLLNIILETNFQNIIEFIKYFDKNHEIKPDSSDKYILNDKYKLFLNPVHGSFSLLKPDIIFTSLYDLLYEPIEIKKLSYKNKLLLYGDIMKPDEANGTILHTIIINDKLNKEDKIEMFSNIDIWINIDIKDVLNNTPLHLAILNNLPEIAKILIEKGADINLQDSQGKTPLHLAILYKLPIIVDKLIEKGANINLQDSQGNTPLHLAIRNNFPEIVNKLIDKLIEQGANINLQNVNGDTTLHFAIKYHFPDIAYKLIEQRANIKLQDNYGDTPLHLAIRNNLTEIAKILIKNGVDINLQNKNGDTPLHLASTKNLPDIVDKLIEKGANINLQDSNGYTPLYLAIMSKNQELIDILINRGADKDLKNRYGSTPLYFAILNNLTEIAKILIENGANINLQDSQGKTPLHLAILYKLPIIVDKLIEKGADMDVKDKVGNTPLQLAIRNNLTEIAKILIENGANINLQDSQGNTPLQLAIENNLPDIVDKLKSQTGGNYYKKYLKYKQKYLKLQENI